MLRPHSFVPRKTDDQMWGISNIAAKTLWNELYTRGSITEIDAFLDSYTDSTCPQIWCGMLRSRRALSKSPKMRCVYDVAFAWNEVLSRFSGPVNDYCKSVISPILVGNDPFKYASQCFNSAVGSEIIGADFSTFDETSHHIAQSEIEEQLELFDLSGRRFDHRSSFCDYSSVPCLFSNT